MQETLSSKIHRLASKKGVLRPADLARHGIPRAVLSRMRARGELERISRGLYAIPGSAISEHRGLAEACRRVPKGVVCLLSALRFHDLTTQAPFEVWMAIPEKAWRPKLDYPPLRIFRFSGKALHEGVETHLIDRVKVQVFNPAKTVADCFKYRNKVGLDVALEALRDCWRERKATMDEFSRYAKICRVANVMRPYLESLV